MRWREELLFEPIEQRKIETLVRVLRLDHNDHLSGRQCARVSNLYLAVDQGVGRYLEVVVADAQLRAAAYREPEQAARRASMWVSLHKITLVQNVVQRFIDVVVVDEHDGLALGHCHLDAVDLRRSPLP